VASKFHHFASCNISEFWFTPSFGMSRHHLPKKKLQRVNRTKKYYRENKKNLQKIKQNMSTLQEIKTNTKLQ
jgi:hypothetical protein